VVDKARAVAKAAIAAVIPRLDESTAAKMDELVRKYAGSL
jgi:hypothetical protein